MVRRERSIGWWVEMSSRRVGFRVAVEPKIPIAVVSVVRGVVPSYTPSDVEIAQGGTRDWFLLAFEHRSNPEKQASVFLLAGSHALQVYVESPDTDHWSEPTRDATEITAMLRDYA